MIERAPAADDASPLAASRPTGDPHHTARILLFTA